jgi:uncharacterized membrane protein YhaH (DUF805 family)
MDQMILPFKKYAQFSGRASRSEYWMFQLLYFIVALFCIALMFLGVGERGLAGIFGGGWGTSTSLGFAILVAWVVLAFIPNLTVTVRRFHDQNLEGWYVLFYLIPWLGQLVVFIFMCLPGTEGDNKFGPDPKTKAEMPAVPPNQLIYAENPIAQHPSTQKLSISGFDATGRVVNLILDPQNSNRGDLAWTIGRSLSAHMPVDDKSVSREHAEIRMAGSSFTITDLGSTNGTKLNGRQLRIGEASQFQPGDTILVGKTELMVSAL